MSWFSDEFYEPIMAGSIDGTDTTPHDHGIIRALKAKYRPEKDPKIRGNPYKTLFIGRLSYETKEETLQEIFGKFGEIRYLRLVRDVVTGLSRGYAFITYEHSADFEEAYFRTNHMVIDGRQILVDFERERVCKGWIPRRFGGGLGGRKESGQLRFGGRDRPFKKPFTQHFPSFAVKRFDERRGIDKFRGRKWRPHAQEKKEEHSNYSSRMEDDHSPQENEKQSKGDLTSLHSSKDTSSYSRRSHQPRLSNRDFRHSSRENHHSTKDDRYSSSNRRSSHRDSHGSSKRSKKEHQLTGDVDF